MGLYDDLWNQDIKGLTQRPSASDEPMVKRFQATIHLMALNSRR
jgi:hypothetical protein